MVTVKTTSKSTDWKSKNRLLEQFLNIIDKVKFFLCINTKEIYMKWLQ